MIIFMAIGFLVLIHLELSKITVTFKVVQDFNLIEFSMSCLYMIRLNFVKIRGDNTHNIVDDENNSILNILQLVEQDFAYQLDTFDKKVKYTTDEIYEVFTDDYVLANVDLTTQLFLFSITNEGKKIQDLSLFDLIQVYFNFFQSINENDDKLLTIDVINLANNSTYLDMVNNNFNQDNNNQKKLLEKNMISMVINYFKNIISAFTKLDENFDHHYNDSIDHTANIIYYCMIALMISSLILLLLTIFLLLIYKSQVIIVMNVIYSINQNLLSQLITKFEIIKNFINLVSSPTNLVKKLKNLNKSIYEKTKKKETALLQRRDFDEKEILIKIKDDGRDTYFSHVVKDQHYILRYFLKLFFVLVFLNFCYFIVGFLLINNQINKMKMRVEYTTAFMYVLDYPVIQLSYIKSSLLLNKTNLEDDYFDQKLNNDIFIKNSQLLGEAIDKVQYILENNRNNFPMMMTAFLSKIKGNSTCEFIVKYNEDIYDPDFYTIPLNDIKDLYSLLCRQEEILTTDLFSIIRYIDIKLREVNFKYISSVKDEEKIRSLYHSKEIEKLNMIISALLRPIIYHAFSSILLPGFNTDLTELLVYAYMILTCNIIMNFVFLFIQSRYILNKYLNNVDSLNILFNILS